MRYFVLLSLTLAVAVVPAADDVTTLKVDLTGAKDGPLTIPLSLPKAFATLDEVAIDVQTGTGSVRATGQLTAPGITTEKVPAKDGMVRRDLHLILTTKANGLTVHLKKVEQQQVERFGWFKAANGQPELHKTLSGRAIPYLRYVNPTYDTSSPKERNASYKVFHHLYDPAGKRLVTNGGFADDKDAAAKSLLYPHHRGIMYGFNKCSYGPDLKGKADTWHCTGDAHVAHEKILSSEAGPVLGRQRVLLGWFGEKNQRFAEEERELTVWNVKGGTLVEFASRLKTTDGKVVVDGDPQHAGFQFRAHNDVAAKTSKETYYLHPDGSKGDKGKERNWPGDKTMVDLPWYAVSFVLGEQRYTAAYLNHPDNPKETRFSERAYARFGGYFQSEITKEKPLVVNYRLWLQDGEMTAEQAAALRTAFAAPPKAAVK